MGCLEGAGVFGVELFLLKDGSIVLNEVAPRPHNSGHYTIEGCGTSQYEAHLRAVLGWPLGDTSLKVRPLPPTRRRAEGCMRAHATASRATPATLFDGKLAAPSPSPMSHATEGMLGRCCSTAQVGAAVMLNVLGEAGGEEGQRAAHELMGRAYRTPGAAIHWCVTQRHFAWCCCVQQCPLFPNCIPATAAWP